MSEEENKILQCIEKYLKEYADDYQKIVVEGGMFGDSIEFTAGYRFMKELMGYIKKQDKEIERLNNIINELEKYCNEVIEETKSFINTWDKAERKALENILNKLKELKENK